LHEHAHLKFTYKKLVEGFKQNKFKKIVVATGAGISVSAGIPDFRSPKTGLYANLEKYDLPTPESIFTLSFFNEKPEAFYNLANEFLDTSKFDPTPTHYFIKFLQDKGLLQFNLT
jgi:NAD-dependent SIR2 family protein deacetylase